MLISVSPACSPRVGASSSRLDLGGRDLIVAQLPSHSVGRLTPAQLVSERNRPEEDQRAGKGNESDDLESVDALALIGHWGCSARANG